MYDKNKVPSVIHEPEKYIDFIRSLSPEDRKDWSAEIDRSLKERRETSTCKPKVRLQFWAWVEYIIYFATVIYLIVNGFQSSFSFISGTFYILLIVATIILGMPFLIWCEAAIRKTLNIIGIKVDRYGE